MIATIIKKYCNGTNEVFISAFDTPIGKIIGAADDNFLHIVAFEDSKNLEKMLENLSKENNYFYTENKNNILQRFDMELMQYFQGKIKKFTVPISTSGSDFQKDVWNKLLELPYGSTTTYGQLAKTLGRPASHARAVGAACGANAHVVLIPCHRVVATGSKGGFSCGLDRKEWLLKHEGKFASL